MPRIIPVIDVMSGHAVRARGGRREDYRRLRSALRPGSDPVELAVAVCDAFDAPEVYLADLDAIRGAPPDLGLYRTLADRGVAAWVDAGVRDAAAIPSLLRAGIARVVVGLETLARPSDLAGIVDRAGTDSIAFSLDLRQGRPVTSAGAAWGTDDPETIAGTVVDAGVRAVIVLDLADVGMDRGPASIGLIRALSVAHPEVKWVGGGGVRVRSDVEALGRAGASAVLVGSAIHDGRIGARLDGESRFRSIPPDRDHDATSRG